MNAVQTIVPESEAHWLELRAQDLTSTEIPALFGVSPYMTEFELFHRKRQNLIVEFEANERSKWGLRLQDSIAHGIAEDQGWEIRRMEEYLREPTRRLGSSYDFAIGKDGLLEIKNVDSLQFRDSWIVDGENIEAPPHIELQVQHQLALSKRDFAHIGALVGGNRLILIKREPDEKVINAIKKRSQEFWNRVDENKEPTPDFSRDSDVIARLYGLAEAGKLFDARGDSEINSLVQEYRAAGEEEKKAGLIKDEVKARLLVRLGDCEKAAGDGFSISAGMVAGAKVEYERKPYRTFRINFKKEKTS